MIINLHTHHKNDTVLRQFRWEEFAKGTVEGTVFEGEPWTEDFFEATDVEEARRVLRERFGERVRLKGESMIVDNGDVTWEERHGLASLCSYYLQYYTRVKITEEMLKGGNVYDECLTINKNARMNARLTAKGRIMLTHVIAPGHPDSDTEYQACIMERDGRVVSPFKLFSPWSEIIDYSHDN